MNNMIKVQYFCRYSEFMAWAVQIGTSEYNLNDDTVFEPLYGRSADWPLRRPWFLEYVYLFEQDLMMFKLKYPTARVYPHYMHQ